MRRDREHAAVEGPSLIFRDREAPNQSFFLNTRTEVPLKSEFKPAMKVLSRKPETASGAFGPGQLPFDNEDQDQDEDEGKARPLTAEERQLKAQQEREEKQKKYEEARQRLFGVNQASASKSSRSTTPPRQRANGESRGSSKSRGMRDPRHLPSSRSGAGPAQQLYDPNYSAKVEATLTNMDYEMSGISNQPSPYEQQQSIRSPRGPDGSGRGGFGFAPRGGKLS